MDKHIEKYFFNKYPDLFVEHILPPTESCMHWGISCENGWMLLLAHLCNNITNHILATNSCVKLHKKLKEENPNHDVPDWATEEVQPVVFKQVKQKMGFLRIYHEGGDEHTKTMINFACDISRYICETCGKFDLTVGSTTKNYIHTSCEDCAANKHGLWKEGDDNWKYFDVNTELRNVVYQKPPTSAEYIQQLQAENVILKQKLNEYLHLEEDDQSTVE